MAGPILEFGDFRLDCDRLQLCRAGRVLKLERKPLELLILLATREGSVVTRTEIADRLWGSEVFVDTEHGINTAIRKVRQALRDDPDKPRFVQTVTGRGYRFVGPVTTIQPALGNGDLTPKPSEEPPISEITTPSRAWLVISSLAALVLLTIAATVRIRAHSTRAATLNIQSLAVLPLDNLSGDPAQNYFADGMTDELTTMLAKNSTLRVVSRTSTKQYKDAHRPLRDIASSLGVDGIVEGSISRADGKVHMTLQLIHAPTDTHIWAESYDRDNNDVAMLPEDAAQAIAKRLNSANPVVHSARYVNPEAHDAYLHGRYLWFGSNYEKSAQYFKKATELQPDYALGWTGLADYYGAGAVEGLLDPRTALPAMVAAAQKAIALDSSLPQAHSTLAATYWINDWDLVRADQEVLRAIELDPEFAEAYHLRGKFLSELNRHEEAIAQEKKAMELDPFARPFALALTYLWARQCDAALTDAKQRLESTPNDALLHEMLSWAYLCKGDKKQGVEMHTRSLLLQGDKVSAEELQHAFEQGGYDAYIKWQIRELQRKSARQYVSPFFLADLYGQLGQREKTLALLEEAYHQHSPLLLDMQNNTDFDSLHNDEHYRTMVRKIGLPPAW